MRAPQDEIRRFLATDEPGLSDVCRARGDSRTRDAHPTATALPIISHRVPLLDGVRPWPAGAGEAVFRGNGRSWIATAGRTADRGRWPADQPAGRCSIKTTHEQIGSEVVQIAPAPLCRMGMRANACLLRAGASCRPFSPRAGVAPRHGRQQCNEAYDVPGFQPWIVRFVGGRGPHWCGRRERLKT